LAFGVADAQFGGRGVLVVSVISIRFVFLIASSPSAHFHSFLFHAPLPSAYKKARTVSGAGLLHADEAASLLDL